MVRRPPGLRVLVLGMSTLAATVAAMAATTGAASAAVVCPNPTSHPFAQWDDTLTSYALTPDGGFEGGGAGWTLTGGARVVSGNESFAVSGAGSHSLSLPAGSSALSPPTCIGLVSTTMRFFAANAGAHGSGLRVQAVYGGGLGALLGGIGQTLGVSDVDTIHAGAAWAPSAKYLMLGGVAPLFTQDVQFRFTPLATGGGWRIDDVYLDPLMHR